MYTKVAFYTTTYNPPPLQTLSSQDPGKLLYDWLRHEGLNMVYFCDSLIKPTLKQCTMQRTLYFGAGISYSGIVSHRKIL